MEEVEQHIDLRNIEEVEEKFTNDMVDLLDEHEKGRVKRTGNFLKGKKGEIVMNKKFTNEGDAHQIETEIKSLEVDKDDIDELIKVLTDIITLEAEEVINKEESVVIKNMRIGIVEI